MSDMPLEIYNPYQIIASQEHPLPGQLDIPHIIDNAPEALSIVSPEGVMLYANKYAIETRIVPREFIGKNVRELESLGILSNPTSLKAIAEQKIVTSTTTHYNGKSYICTALPIFDQLGNVEFVFCVTIEKDFFYDRAMPFKEQISLFSNSTHVITHENAQEASLIAKSKEMQDIIGIIGKVAATKVPVFFQGETGVGKEELAKLVYGLSDRKSKPLLAVNCACIPPALMESQLFGHEKGAFTGATGTQMGLFEHADGGTLFLDEVGELKLGMQTKLLRALQEGVIRRVGGWKDIPVDVRIISATNQDISEMVKQKKFRRDLFYRLNVILIDIPPLRRRPSDLYHLIRFFIEKHNKQYKTNKYISNKLWSHLMQYAWPGNTRELCNIIERLILLSSSDEISPDCLPPEMLEEAFSPEALAGALANAQTDALADAPCGAKTESSLEAMLQKEERRILTEAKKQFGTCRKIAEALSIDYSSVARKLKKYGL